MSTFLHRHTVSWADVISTGDGSPDTGTHDQASATATHIEAPASTHRLDPTSMGSVKRWRDHRHRVHRDRRPPHGDRTDPVPGCHGPRHDTNPGDRVCVRVACDRPRPRQEATANTTTARPRYAVSGANTQESTSPQYPRGWPVLEGAAADGRTLFVPPDTPAWPRHAASSRSPAAWPRAPQQPARPSGGS